jgi:hypothetical protein
MTQVFIILGWLIALGCFVFLVLDSLKRRFPWLRRRKKTALKADATKWRSALDEGPSVDAADRRFRRNMKPLWYVSLVLWEGYWIAEIAERFARPNPFQLPYFFLLVMMVGVPLAVYLFVRRPARPA